jgi:hypothetical protein
MNKKKTTGKHLLPPELTTIEPPAHNGINFLNGWTPTAILELPTFQNENNKKFFHGLTFATSNCYKEIAKPHP